MEKLGRYCRQREVKKEIRKSGGPFCKKHTKMTLFGFNKNKLIESLSFFELDMSTCLVLCLYFSFQNLFEIWMQVF